MNSANSQLQVQSQTEAEGDEGTVLSADELLLIGGGQCITNSI